MHRIRAWAHSTAHGQHFGPNDEKSHKNENDAPQNDEEQQETPQNSRGKPKIPLSRQIVQNLRVIFLEHNKWLNILLIAAPVGIAVHAAGVSKYADFAVNAVAIVPLAGLLTFATESIAARTTPTLAALLNVSFGNSVELIIFIIALIKNEIRIVQASLVGSILANLLLILGMAMAAGGLKYQEQLYDSIVTQTSSSLLVLSVLSLLIPTVFHASFNDQVLADDAVIKLSRGTAVILLLVYLLYLTFQLSSHAYLYEGTPQYIIDQNTEPGILQRMDSTHSSSSESTSRSSSVSSSSSGVSGGLKRRMKKKGKIKLGRRRSTRTEEAVIEEEEMKASPDGIVSFPTEAAEGSSVKAEKRERKVPPPPAGLQPTAGTGRIQTPSRSGNITNDANNNQSTATSTTGRPFMGRAISIRPPPVFRAESQMNHQMAARYRLRDNELRRFNSTPNMSTVASTPRPQKAFTAPNRTTTGLFNSNGAELPQTQTKEEPPIGLKTAIILLLSSTALVAICAEFMVGSIEYLVDNSPLSEAFIGLIILPIVGNAAEHVTSVVVAYRNQMDLALGVALGSSIQIALFITPLVVIIGWIADKGMSLYFTLFETVSVFVAVFISCFLCLDGRSNYLEGTLLFAAYVIIAVGAYFFPDSQNANSFTGGTATGARRLLLRDL